MAVGGAITTAGKNVLLNRGYLSVPTYLEPTHFKIGVGTTTPAVGDTDLEQPVEFLGVEMLDACDAVLGWGIVGGSQAGAAVLDNVTFKEGTGSLGLPKTGVAGTDASWDKTIGAPLDGTSKDFWVWVYVLDAATLAKLADPSFRIMLGSGAAAYYWFDVAKADVAVGWNYYVQAVPFGNQVGAPVIGALDYLRIEYNTLANGDLIAATDFIMDYWRLVSADDYRKAYLVGYPVFDEVNRTIEVRGYVNSLEGNGFNITECGEINMDVAPLVPNKLVSHDVFTAISKSTTDEILIIWKHELV